MSGPPSLSLLPRVEQLYWALRGLVLLSLFLYTAVEGLPGVRQADSWMLVALYAALFAVPLAVVRWRRWRFSLAFWPIFVADTVSVAWLVHLTGGVESNFFVLYFALVPFVSYYMGLSVGLITAGAVTGVYAVSCVISGGAAALIDLIFRAIMLWVFTGAMGLASQYVHRFAQRLLNAMDKLNERTSELERTHAQLETIYETSRSLGQLLSVDNVIDRVLSIARSVLNYPTCEVYTWDPAQKKLRLQGRLDEKVSLRLEHPRVVEPSPLYLRVIRDGEIGRVLDRHAGRAVIDGNPNRSQLAVPMVSEGKVVGLLNAESPHVNAFGERDERVLSVLAASTAMALVNADLHQQMEKLTIIDELTGLFNYRYFRTRLEDEKRRATRYGQPLSLIMVDIDWFKSLNDRFGHEFGNLALRQIAAVVGSGIRDVDTLARFGGEEFIVILPQTSGFEAQAIGERIRQRVEQTKFGPDAAGRPIHVTVSIGISCFPDNGLPEDDLVRSVDQALYRAKGSGKNAVCMS